MIKLGQKVTDHVTGFTGTATGRAEYLDGSVSVFVEPVATPEGTWAKKGRWISEMRLIQGEPELE